MDSSGGGRRRGGFFELGEAGFFGGLEGGEAAGFEGGEVGFAVFDDFAGVDALADEGLGAAGDEEFGVVSVALIGGGIAKLVGIVEFVEVGDFFGAEGDGLGGVALGVHGDVVVVGVGLGSGVESFEFLVGFGAGLVAPFFFGEEEFVGVFEGGEFVFEVGDGDAAAEALEDVAFEEGEDAGAEGAAVGLAVDLEGGGGLLEDLDFQGVGIPGGVESAQSAGAGLELQSFGPGFGEGFEDFVVGVVVAEVDDLVLVLGREGAKDGLGFVVHSAEMVVRVIGPRNRREGLLMGGSV